MEIQAVKCPCCGAPFGAGKKSGLYQCGHCDSTLEVKINNNQIQVIQKEEEQKKNEVPKPVEEQPKEVKPETDDLGLEYEFIDDEPKKFSGIKTKQKVLAIASAFLMALTAAPVGAYVAHKIVSGSPSKTKISAEDVQKGVDDLHSKYFRHQISDEEFIQGLHSLGIQEDPNYLATIGRVREETVQTPDDKKTISEKASYITEQLYNEDLTPEEAEEALRQIGIDVDPNYTSAIEEARREEMAEKEEKAKKQEALAEAELISKSQNDGEERIGVIYQNDNGDIQVVSLTKDDYIVCDKNGGSLMFLSPREDGDYTDVVTGSQVHLNEDYWNMVSVSNITDYKGITVYTNSGTSVIYSDDVIQVVTSSSKTAEVQAKGK